MGCNFKSNLHIDIKLQQGVKQDPEDWLQAVVEEVFAGDDVAEYCDIESADRYVNCENIKTEDENLIDSVSLEYTDFNVGGDYDTDYDELLAKIVAGIKTKLETAGAIGDIRIAGYDTDRKPDISAFARVGREQLTGVLIEVSQFMHDVLAAIKEHDDRMNESDSILDIALPGDLRCMVVEAIAQAEGRDPGEAVVQDVAYLDRIQGIEV
ncbi:MAG TPA: hypothetical protein DEB39_01570 [Planctomycetaceae bacterium]|nr:hypothetical protein [Planctomycetaceae bacterium]